MILMIVNEDKQLKVDYSRVDLDPNKDVETVNSDGRCGVVYCS